MILLFPLEFIRGQAFTAWIAGRKSLAIVATKLHSVSVEGGVHCRHIYISTQA